MNDCFGRKFHLFHKPIDFMILMDGTCRRCWYEWIHTTKFCFHIHDQRVKKSPSVQIYQARLWIVCGLRRRVMFRSMTGARRCLVFAPLLQNYKF